MHLVVILPSGLEGNEDVRGQLLEGDGSDITGGIDFRMLVLFLVHV